MHMVVRFNLKYTSDHNASDSCRTVRFSVLFYMIVATYWDIIVHE